MWYLISSGECFGEVFLGEEDISSEGDVLLGYYKGAQVREVLVGEVWVKWEDYKKEGE